MVINSDGSISVKSDGESNIKKAQKDLNSVKQITSIFIDNAVPVQGGYFINTDVISTTTKKLINYLKHSS